MQKYVDRSQQSSDKIFDSRTLQNDFKTILPIIKPGLRVLDVGCGTGAISKDIAELVGNEGVVIGIDNTLDFIDSGKKSYSSYKNLDLQHADLMNYETELKFDLIVSARTFQWLSNPTFAISKLKSFLADGGTLSILDYNHEEIAWKPNIPSSMLEFYDKWLEWRKDAGMNNRMAEDLSTLFEKAGLKNIEVRESNEFYSCENSNFTDKIGIWKKVASSTQLVKEGYVSDSLRTRAIQDYQNWIETEADSMLMVLKEVRGQNL